MSPELPVDSIKADEVLLGIYNKTKTLFLDPIQTLIPCFKLLFVCLNLFSLRKKKKPNHI